MSRAGIVVIAYGNSLRGDDGVAWRAADQLKKKFASADISVLQQHQLVPELAERISRARAVIFVDAADAQAAGTHTGEIRIDEIEIREIDRSTRSPFHHQLSPGSLLALAEMLYGSGPRAFVATLTGEDFSPGERLSPLVERALPDFLAKIERLIGELIKAQN